jgi:hypothetical protein
VLLNLDEPVSMQVVYGGLQLPSGEELVYPDNLGV